MKTQTMIIEEYLINSKSPVEVCNAFRDHNERLQALRAEAKDLCAFVNWIVQEIDDDDQMIRIVKRAKENPFGMNDDCQRSVDLFLSYVAEGSGCDHSVGVCSCALSEALGERDFVEEALLGSDID